MASEQTTPKPLKISVRELVEFSAREGDIVSDFYVGVSALDGIRGHQYIQKHRDPSWLSECSVAAEFNVLGVVVQLSGRIDLVRPKDMVSNAIVEEIKVGMLPKENIPREKRALQKAQAKVYSYLFALQYRDWCDDIIDVKITWFEFHKRRESSDIESLSVEALQDYVLSLLNRYVSWLNAVEHHFETAIGSAQKLDFPFHEYRDNQQAFSRYVYRCIRDQESLLVQAPTGTGKTISVLFPAIKSLALLNSLDRPQVYFLTCKNSGQRPAIDTLKLLNRSGFKGAFLQLQAKERMCPCKLSDDTKPDSDVCTRCVGFYDRLPGALEQCIAQQDLSVSSVQSIADQFHVCPYELSRQLLGCVPVVVCDINYVFDPMIGFSDLRSEPINSNRLFLLDEIHNLSSRARSMYSSSLDAEKIARLEKQSSRALGKVVASHSRQLRIFLDSHGKLLEQAFVESENVINSDSFKPLFSLIDELIESVYQAIGLKFAKSDGFTVEETDGFFDVVWELYRFKELLILSDKGSHLSWFNQQKLVLTCLSPAQVLSKIMSLARVAVGFSGTLTPLEFYGFETGFDAIEKNKQQVLKSDAGVCHYPLRLLSLMSPFDERNQLTLITNFIDYSYQHRESADGTIAQMVADVSQLHPGKYLVFVPSFESLENLANCLTQCDVNSMLIKQNRGESEFERNHFIENFTSESSVIALAVLGGVYSEALSFDGGVDGIFVIGTGIPAPSKEQEQLKRYYQERQYDGFEFTCLYPGFTKVQQAVGRLIRSEKDRGVVVLVDSRFNQVRYRNLMPRNWNPVICDDIPELTMKIRDFWR